jgi:hypothetical protein
MCRLRLERDPRAKAWKNWRLVSLVRQAPGVGVGVNRSEGGGTPFTGIKVNRREQGCDCYWSPHFAVQGSVLPGFPTREVYVSTSARCNRP